MTVFQATINIKAMTWKRTGEGIYNQRFMPTTLRNYYYQVYDALREKGLRPLLPAPVEYRGTFVFQFTDKRWRDTDNLMKAVMDCGQPSKWSARKDRPFMPDFWDDKQFAELHVIRVRGCHKNCIEISITEWEGYSG